MNQEILYSVADWVATITLNRPDKLNAWTPRMEEEVRVAVHAATADDNARAIVVTGAGRGFCSGADMSSVSAMADETGPVQAESADNFEQRFSFLLATPKPVFMAINGPVAGLGVSLAVYGDFRYMAEGAKLTTAFAKRGLIAEHGTAWILPRLIGTANALDLLCSARVIQASEAQSFGLVRMLPAEGFLAAVQGIAREMVTTASPRSIGVIKRQVYRSHFQSLAEAWALADKEAWASAQSEDYREGVAHFLEKRAPAFTGR
jgi:enoyl-CoA hydratase/carnithine racemase